jgi:manganese-dependent inorganic pyrophosphatase
MFEATSDLAGVSAEAIVARDAKEYEVSGGQTITIAQVETVGHGGLNERREELLAAMDDARERRGHALYALMVTDILAKDTELYVSGDAAPIEQAFDVQGTDGVLVLPGVMSRKKQVAPKVLAAL